ncbi:natural resistance-associated macrophage protein [Hypoxylon trugodes]|uniref:natural resistance-associated macrophage protein n=1 Tax=Hypoxylon trugodes TaxID=326681 RepID=UPI00219DB823|nr:natural resistance-associated macrophage protein [Hypoxylon trugodes]KAI1387424.1 natural resistance-associated macrophage protein [Hypoxylon trugodes]
MNQTSRTDEPYEGEGLNQSPNALSNDLVTNSDLNGIANAREHRSGDSARSMDNSGQPVAEDVPPSIDEDPDGGVRAPANLTISARTIGQSPGTTPPSQPLGQVVHEQSSIASHKKRTPLRQVQHTLFTFCKFVGPGFLVAVAYIDPGNYSTDISAGAENQFRLLFIILMSNLFAIFLQCLSIKLGTVTGLNLAEACRAFLPRWLNYFLYFMAEAAIIATDIAEVIGTAIGLNLLIPKLPLVAGCALSILDVMVILIFYQPHGTIKGLRAFEFFVMLLVLAVVICFCIQLSLITGTTPGEVFLGYVPNDSITQSSGLFQACGILGATVMPHSLYLGSGIVQSRLKDYDTKRGLLPPEPASAPNSTKEGKTGEKTYYVPSLSAIKHSLKYSYAEVSLSLFTFALFVNSAILIVAGASLFNNPNALEADIFGIHDLLSESISPAAGTIFALALLFSGVSAGIVCTISGQMICEGALKWKMQPWLRRLVTRSISITPSIIIAGAAGREKLNAALNGSQVALSVVLPFVSAPLIWFTCFGKYMTAQPGHARYKTEGKDTFVINGVSLGLDAEGENGEMGLAPANRPVRLANPWYVSVLAGLIWLIIVAMNVANLVLLGLGNA